MIFKPYLARISILSGVLIQFLLGQSDPFSFRNISVEDGLSESTVKVIFEDHNGFIYFGTENGLDYYNGYEFLNYQMKSFDETSILGNKISCIYEDSKNKIWIGSELGISKFDPNTRTFIRPEKLDEKSELALINPETFAEDHNGNIWVKLFNSNSIFQLNSKKDTTVCMNCGREDLLKNISIQILYEDDDKTIWIGSESGLFYFDRTQDEIVPFKANSELFQSQITAIAEGKSGELWIGTTQGLGKIATGSSNTVTVFIKKSGLNSILSNTINDLNWDNEKQELWIATNDGLSRFDAENNKFHNIQETPYANSIIENNVNEILIAEKSGKLWFTTENYPGINCLSITLDPYFGELDTSFTHFEHDPVDPNSLADNNISAFIEDKAGHVWIGTP